MAYRTRINGVQVFGNNDYFKEYIDFLKANGIEDDEDGHYEGYITDVKGLFEVIDKITKRLIKERHEKIEKGEKNWDGEPLREMADFSNSIWLDDKTPVLWFNMRTMDDAYVFLPYQVYRAIQDKLEPSEETYSSGEMSWLGCSYKLKDGEKIHVYAG